jgi:hypothetical protein
MSFARAPYCPTGAQWEDVSEKETIPSANDSKVNNEESSDQVKNWLDWINLPRYVKQKNYALRSTRHVNAF